MTKGRPGDPQQLDQPQRGVHPPGADGSGTCGKHSGCRLVPRVSANPTKPGVSMTVEALAMFFAIAEDQDDEPDRHTVSLLAGNRILGQQGNTILANPHVVRKLSRAS